MIREVQGGVEIRVWAKPRASKTRLLGRRVGPRGQEALEIALAAPPAEGAANRALLEFLAERLGLPKSAVTLGSGAGSREKLVRAAGIGRAEVIASLGV